MLCQLRKVSQYLVAVRTYHSRSSIRIFLHIGDRLEVVDARTRRLFLVSSSIVDNHPGVTSAVSGEKKLFEIHNLLLYRESNSRNECSGRTRMVLSSVTRKSQSVACVQDSKA